MITALPYLLGILILLFFVKVIMLWRELWKNYKYLRTKYPVSIWKLPSRNLHLLNESDCKSTKKLYMKYALTLLIGIAVIIGMSAILIQFESHE